MTPDNDITRKAEADVARGLREHKRVEAEIQQNRRAEEAKLDDVTPEGRALTPKPIER